MGYIEGFAIPVPAGKKGAYRDMAAKAAPVVSSSKAFRDAGNAKMEEDLRMEMSSDMPFDSQRMIYGGFEVLFDADGRADG